MAFVKPPRQEALLLKSLLRHWVMNEGGRQFLKRWLAIADNPRPPPRLLGGRLPTSSDPSNDATPFQRFQQPGQVPAWHEHTHRKRRQLCPRETYRIRSRLCNREHPRLWTPP